MKAVVSQTWLITADHAVRYVELAAAFDPWLQARPGFIGRTLIQGHDDPTHIIHVRLFRDVEDYLVMLREPEYQDHLEQLIELVDPGRYPPGAVKREFGDVIHYVMTDPAEAEGDPRSLPE
jgi:hypothetical protein